MSVGDHWRPHGRGYKNLSCADKEDKSILYHLEMYTPLNESERKTPQFRHWRRLLVREALKRGLIAEDPGSPP